MSYEIEVKFKVASHDALRRRLRALGAAFRQTVIQTDSYFDTPGRALHGRQAGLRVRETAVRRCAKGVRPGPRPQLTFKGPLRANSKAKIRREIQTHFDSPDALTDVLLALGYEVILNCQKRRSTYSLGRCLIELDELPLIGTYIEIEGPGERQVLALARKLGLEGDPIKTSYAHLIASACKAKGRRPIGIKLR